MTRALKALVAVAAIVAIVVLVQRTIDNLQRGSDTASSSDEPTSGPSRTPASGGGASPAGDDKSPGHATAPPAPDGAPAEGLYVLSQITEDGTVEVQTWLRSREPVSELTLTTTDPDLAPGTVESLDLVVRSMDDKVLARRQSVGTEAQTVQLRTPVTELYFSYTIDGAMSQATQTVAGRSLARVVGMDVQYAGEGGPVLRLVDAPGRVLNVACLAPEEDFDANPRPCGASTEDGDWLVELKGADLHDRLLASIET